MKSVGYLPLRPRDRLYQEIVDQIQAQVQSGALSPGDRLPPERELAEQFGVSRTAVREAIKSLTGGKGPDVVYDPVGGDYTEPAFRSIAWRGRYLVVGFASGPTPSLPLNLPLLKGASIVGVFWGGFAKAEPKANAAMMAELASWYAQGKIKPVIDSTMPMSELKAAYAHMGSRGVKGKLVMVN